MMKWFRKGNRRGKSSATSESDFSETEGCDYYSGNFSLAELSRATRGFSYANKVAKVDGDIVYVGELSDGSPVIIREISSTSNWPTGRAKLKTEIRIQSHLLHQNIARLLGHCVEGEHLLLVYEFMENANLERILFDGPPERCKLNWEKRLKICKGVAKALNYLHHELSGSNIVVHRDIKPSNIFLESDFNPKLLNFSFSKLLDREENDGSTVICGTLGYIAPEYQREGRITSKVDVYSFGIFLLDIACAIPRGDLDRFHVQKTVRELKRKGKLLDILDPSLGKDYSVEQAKQLLNLAIVCTEEDPNQRPDMPLVLGILEGKEMLSDPFQGNQNVYRYDRNLAVRGTSPSCSFDDPSSTGFDGKEEDQLTGDLDKLLHDLSNISIGPSVKNGDLHGTRGRGSNYSRHFEELKTLVLGTDFKEAVLPETRLKLLPLCQDLVGSSDLSMEEEVTLDQVRSFLDDIPELSSAVKVQDDQSLYVAKYDSVREKVESARLEARKLQDRTSTLRASVASINEEVETVRSEISKLQNELDSLKERRAEEEEELREIGRSVASSVREIPPLATWLSMEFKKRSEAEDELNQAIECLRKGETEWSSIQKRFR